MPAKPRRLFDRPFDAEVRRAVDRALERPLDEVERALPRLARERVELERVERDAVERERVERDLVVELRALPRDFDRLAVDRLRERPALERLELDRAEDFFPRCDLVSPFSRRILLTVRAATSSARPPYRPDFLALCLMC